MTPLTVLDKVVEALQAAGATEEMIAAAVGAAGVADGVVPAGVGASAPSVSASVWALPQRHHGDGEDTDILLTAVMAILTALSAGVTAALATPSRNRFGHPGAGAGGRFRCAESFRERRL